MINNYIVIIIVVIILIYLYANNINNTNNTNKEGFGFVENEIVPQKLLDSNGPFEVVIKDKLYGVDLIIRLDHLFNFIDYFQVEDMDPRNDNTFSYCLARGDKVKIQNAIREMLKALRFIVYSNNKDNFYHRFIVSKVGPNLQEFMNDENIVRRLNYDEMVRNRIGKQFTFLENNEYDKYYPRPNLDSMKQSPLKTSINVHNYYTYDNIMVNLLALKIMIGLIQHNNQNVFNDIVRPSEHIIFEEEFMIPMKSIINNILTIATTNSYEEYLHHHKMRDV